MQDKLIFRIHQTCAIQHCGTFTMRPVLDGWRKFVVPFQHGPLITLQSRSMDTRIQFVFQFYRGAFLAQP